MGKKLTDAQLLKELQKFDSEMRALSTRRACFMIGMRQAVHMICKQGMLPARVLAMASARGIEGGPKLHDLKANVGPETVLLADRIDAIVRAMKEKADAEQAANEARAAARAKLILPEGI